MQKNKITLSILFFLLCLLPITVDAEEVSFRFCVSGNGAYTVMYNTDVATEVVRDNITAQDILNGHVPYPEGVSDDDKKKYEFTASRYSVDCTVSDDGNVEVCPTAKQTSDYPIYDTYGRERDSYITFTLKENGNFDIKIKALYDKGLYIRPILDGSGRTLNTSGENTASAYSDQFLTASNGYYYYNNVTGSTSDTVRFLTLEFYVKESGGCNGVYFGTVGISLPNPNTYDIKNPALPANDPNDVYGCKAVLDYAPTGMTNDEITEYLTPIKTQYIYECYKEKIKYSEKSALATTISNKLTKLKEMFKDYSGSTSSSNSTICEASTDTLSKSQVYKSDKTYWIMTCTETYKANGDTAKLVKAGNGFKYQSNFYITKECKISYVGPVVQKKPQCTKTCYHRCYWPGDGEGWDGGPTEDFDKCILECDNGQYTQNCINSCYSKVYGVNRDVSFTDKFGAGIPKQKRTVDRIVHDCVTDHNNNGESATNSCGQTYCVSDYCKENGWCENYETITPDGCSFTPEADYQRDINSIKTDLIELANKQKADISVGKFTYKITDSYLKTSNGNEYVFTVNNTNNPKLGVDINRPKDEKGNNKDNKGTSDSVKIGSENTYASYNPSWFRGANVTVNLPLSYVDKVTSSSVYKTSENSTNKKDAYVVNHLNNRLDSVNDFIASKYYHDSGERKYYTNAFSDSINVVTKDGKIVLISKNYANKNIEVINSDVGNSKFSSNIKCYYGVYNNFYSDCGKDDPDCPCDPDTEICDGGIQYIYRPIDLTNIFPGDVNNGVGRNPRWNWTGTVTDDKSTGAALTAKESLYSGDQTVDPQKLIQDIESKGESIYDVKKDSSEIDYEFVLTRENIRNIRKYNDNVEDYNGDGEKNYLDYNMSCYYDTSAKRDVCTSRFMDNINGNSGTDSADRFISYKLSSYGYDITDRKSIAGCNNAINGNQCDYFR